MSDAIHLRLTLRKQNFCTWSWNARHTPERTVILLHGYLDLGRVWEPIATRLAADSWRVIAPDLRGHGDSAALEWTASYQLQDFILDLVELVEQLTPHERIALVGHSFGGSIASYFTACFPERVSHLALLEGVGPPAQRFGSVATRLATWIAKARHLQRSGPATYADVAAAALQIRSSDRHCSQPMSEELVEHYTRPRGDRLEFRHDPALVAGDPWGYDPRASEFWSAIQCPTLLMDAEDSWYVQQVTDLSHRYAQFRQGRHIRVPRGGHSFFRHEPEVTTQHLLTFLNHSTTRPKPL